MPIRRRLALWYGGMAAVCCILVTVAAYATHTRAHYDDLDRLLRGAAEHVVDESEEGGSGADLAQLLSAPIAPELTLRAYGPNGETIAQSQDGALVPAVDPRMVLARPSGPPYGPLVRLAPALVKGDPGPGAYALSRDAAGNRWRLYVAPSRGPASYLLTAAPLQRIDASVSRFRLLVAMLATLSSGGTFLAAGLLAGRALKPMLMLTESARTIARSRGFNRRVPVSRQQDELGQLAMTFNEMLASLERAYEAQQRFVSDASHELRAPLTAIQANLDLLERWPDMPVTEREEAVHAARGETVRLSVLVSDLLTLARADTGVPLRSRRVELDRVLMDAFGEARLLARGQRLEVERLHPVMVDGDPDRLKQLFLILLDNAIKYTPPDGTIVIALERQGSSAEITVRDTGVGIVPADLPRVFERFFRADPARSRDPGGTGLGLPIARWITEQHGGEVALASEPGQGTTATVRLPVSV